jgi:opacity protein-like surface antigen
MKKPICLVSFLLVILSASARADLSLHGPYLGFQGGMAFPHDISVDPDFAGRGYAGYRFNDMFGMELGYARYIDKDKATVQDGDLMAKLTIPILLGLNIFAEGGLAYVDQNEWGTDTQGFAPELGAGIGYTLLRVVTIDVSDIHLFGVGDINSIDFASVGLTVTF